MPEVVKKGQVAMVRALIDSATIDKATKTFEVVFATENPVYRSYYWADEPFYEVLVCDKKSIRAERLDAGVVPLLDTHMLGSVTQQYGRALTWSIKNGECRAKLQYSFQDSKADLWNDIENGVITGISVGPRIWKYERVPNSDPKKIPTYRAVDWEIMEMSFAPVPIDYKSAVRAEDNRDYSIEILNYKNENRSNMEPNLEKQIRDAVRAAGLQDSFGDELTGRAGMTLEIANTEISAKRAAGAPALVPAPAAAAPVDGAAERAAGIGAGMEAERERQTQIRAAVGKTKLPGTVADDLVGKQANGGYLTVDAARALIIDKLAEMDTNVGAGNASGASARGQDIRDTNIPMVEALMERAQPGSVARFYNLDADTKGRSLSEAGKDFRFMSLQDMCRAVLQKNGIKATGMSPDELASRAMNTTDMPDLFTSTVKRFLRMNYEPIVPEWMRFSRQVPANDFRVKTGVKVDSAVTFEELAQNGEYKESTLISDEKATIQLKTYARKFSVTRQTIINDDLSTLSRVPQMIGIGARQFQSKKVWALITGNALCPDGKALFHADHGNLGNGAAASMINDDSLSAARVSMLRQKSPQGNELDIFPKYLVVPAELLTKAQKLLRTINPTIVDAVNIWSFLDPIEIRYLTDALAWYVFAEPGSTTVDGIVHAYLDGQEGLYTESYIDKDTDSLVIKARQDFDCAVWGWQGMYKNVGAALSQD